MSMSNRRRYQTPKRVSDIEIARVFEVVCNDCGVIDAPRSYKTALKSRRRHFEQAHQEGAETR